jgi:Transmembrane exosortase (Exosortase_EpsH).
MLLSHSTAGMQADGGLLTGNRHGDLLRIAAIPVFVYVCYLFDWALLRQLTCDLFVAAAEFLSIPVVRTSPTFFECEGRTFYFAISCTAVDAFCGSIPLLWHRADWKRTTVFWTVYFLVLSAVNLFRLVSGFFLFVHGVPWWIAHKVFGGLFYFGLLLWIIRMKSQFSRQAVA